jgi:hypothetical protein
LAIAATGPLGHRAVRMNNCRHRLYYEARITVVSRKKRARFNLYDSTEAESVRLGLPAFNEWTRWVSEV